MVELVSVLREFELQEKAADQHQNLVFESYAHDDELGARTFARRIPYSNDAALETTIVMDGSRTIGSGEDPRPFIWRGSHCVSAQTFEKDHGFINKIYVARDSAWLTLIPPEGLFVGKNWTPFVQNDELFFIHEFAPFRILKARQLSPLDSFLLLDLVAEHSFITETSHDKYSRFRGGSNALAIGGKVVGFGHTNEIVEEEIVHRPFGYVYEPDTQVTYYDFAFECHPAYKIVDPTSFYRKDGQFYLVTCETETVWDQTPQMGRVCLYSLGTGECEHGESLSFGGRRIYRWTHGETPPSRGLLGAWRRSRRKRV